MAFFNFIESFFGSYPFLLIVICISFVLKLFLLTFLFRFASQSIKISQQCVCLSLVLTCGMIENFAWIIKLIQILFIPSLDYRIILFFIRIAWACTTIQYQALSLFIEGLINKNKFTLPLRQKVLFGLSFIISSFFLYKAMANFQCISAENRDWLERGIQRMVPLYCLMLLLLPSIIIATKKARTASLPRILKKQIHILVKIFLLPQLISDLIQTFPLFPYGTYYYPAWITNSYAVVAFSTILLTLAMYFCAQKMIGLRFLNFRKHVETKPKLTFVDNFKGILQRFSHINTFQELAHLTQVFFKDFLNVPFSKTKLYMHKLPSDTDDQPNAITMHTATLAETFLETHPGIIDILRNSQILIYDELDFTNFYNNNDEQSTILHFLNTLDADIFLPLFEKTNFVGYIIIDRHARQNEFYNSLERDEMLVFASYLGNIIHLMKNKSLELLIEHKQRLTNELYAKHKEIEQYKESMRSFLRTTQQDIGVLYYHSRKFVFGNATAKTMIPININAHEGHPITQRLRQLAKMVEEYKSPQSTYIKDPSGNQLVLSALPHLDKNMVIITISHPNVTDIVKKQVDALKNPSEWDYLLYLETTKSGRLINQLIPGAGPTLLPFKVDLLKASLSTKAVLIDVHEQDLVPTVELLHHISLREKLHTLSLNGPSKDYAIANMLFGINPIFNDGKDSHGQSLLKQLDDSGTLFIKNIHFLDIETQNYLAEFIRYGIFRIFKSDRKIHSNARIICSTDQNLFHLAQQGTFSSALFDEIQHTVLRMPSLISLPDNELQLLAEGFSEQVMQNKTLDNLLLLTEREKYKIAQMRPASLTELKNKVQQLLVSKSKKHDIYQETAFNPAYEITDPELIQAKCLGRRALKDRKTMIMLWHKFKNQSDIATFLGVNRSSINRRCKEYNLQ